MLYTADFETTTYLDENEAVRVWAFGLCQIGNADKFEYGNNLDDFMKWCSNGDNNILYFHNLKFDDSYIISWLLHHNFKHVTEKKDIESNTFTTLISDMNLHYSLEIYFERKGKHTKKVTIYDSMKLLPFSVEQIAKDFKLPIKKIEKEQEFYQRERKVGHKLTEEEIEYLANDVKVMSLALKTLFDSGQNKMTTGSNALNEYKTILGKKNFDKYFPIPDYDIDEDIRQSYKGGFTYVNPKYQNIDCGNGIVLDVNSLYPSVMYFKPLPYGDGKYFKGQYQKDKFYPLYVQFISCQFELKEGYLPTIQMKNNLKFMPTEYVTSSKDKNGKDEERILCLTSVDLELFLEHYEPFNLEYLSGWKFKATTELFKDYIDKWMTEKIKAKNEGNGGMYTLSKLMLNSLYGKFALNPKVQSKNPYLDDEGIVRYELGDAEIREAIYIPCGTFITAWARYETITTAQSVIDIFAYADTDSLHLITNSIPTSLENKLSDTELGKWKHEFTFEKARYLRQKSYIEYGYEPKKPEEKYTKVTCAGMSHKLHDKVNFDNFHIGSKFGGSLKQVTVKGGILLKETEFTISK
jgi:hypothetical protein